MSCIQKVTCGEDSTTLRHFGFMACSAEYGLSEIAFSITHEKEKVNNFLACASVFLPLSCHAVTE